MDMDFIAGPLLGTFHFILKRHSARSVLNIAHGTGPTLKPISFGSLTFVLNVCSQLSSLTFLFLKSTSKHLNPTPLPLALDSYTLLHHRWFLTVDS